MKSSGLLLDLFRLIKRGDKSVAWIGCDLDGTLATYDHYRGDEHIGEPIEKMVARVKRWLADGKQVKLLTARASHGDKAKRAVKVWCRKHIGKVLPITDRKDCKMTELWDDRAHRVERNTGEKLASISIATASLFNFSKLRAIKNAAEPPTGFDRVNWGQFDPRFRPHLLRHVREMWSRGYDPVLGSGYRDSAQQKKVHEKGFSKLRTGSAHQYGMGADVVARIPLSEGGGWDGAPKEFWTANQQSADASGLRWGGRFTYKGKPNPDPAHVELEGYKNKRDPNFKPNRARPLTREQASPGLPSKAPPPAAVMKAVRPSQRKK